MEVKLHFANGFPSGEYEKIIPMYALSNPWMNDESSEYERFVDL
jgi:hypothetical protein